MKSQHLTLACFLAYGRAHYVFSRLIINHTVSDDFEYVRTIQGTDGNPDLFTDMTRFAPEYDIYTTNVTCGRDAFDAAPTTATADVIAGSEIGFKISELWSKDPIIFHPGPAQAYIARPPNGDLSRFSGIDADWIKIAFIGASSDTKWITYNANTVNFTIPSTTPPGKYLLRFEQFWPTPRFNSTQWYVSCAHVNVIGQGGGSFDGYEFAKFPGTYDIEDPGLWTPINIGDMTKLLSYQPPGPAVWTG